MQPHKTFCVLPHIGMNVHTDGGLSPCCYFDRHPQNVTHQFHNYTNWRENAMAELASNLDNGVRDPRCARCWDLEDNGVASHRQRWNTNYPDLQPDPGPRPLRSLKMLHLDLDNYCNLRCIMCHPKVSSSIESEYRANEQAYHEFIEPYRPVSGPWHGTDQFEQLLGEIDQVDHLILTGGEPLINPTVLRLLNKINLDQCHLIVTTNAALVRPQVYDLLSRAGSSTVTVSLEGVGAHNDYLRYGSDWATVERNIEWLAQLPNWRWVPININHTLQASSAWALPPLLDWCIDKKHVFNINTLTWPHYLSIECLSDQKRQHLIDQLRSRQPIIEYTFGKLGQQNHWLANAIKQLEQARHDLKREQQFYAYVAMLDRIRGTSWQDLFTGIS